MLIKMGKNIGNFGSSGLIWYNNSRRIANYIFVMYLLQFRC